MEFCIGICLFSPLSSGIFLHQCGLAYAPFILRALTAVLFGSPAVPALATESSFAWFLHPFDRTPSVWRLVLSFFFFFFKVFWLYKMLQAHGVDFLTSSGVPHFCREPSFLSPENGVRNPRRGGEVYTCSRGGFAPWPPQPLEQGEVGMQVLFRFLSHH